MFRYTVYGRRNVPRTGGFLVACNHESNLDPVLAGIAVVRTIHYMAKAELFSNKLLAWLLLNVNAFPVKRESADISAIKEAIKRVRRKEGLLLFPQGTRRSARDQALPGIGFFAAKLQVPIVPVYIDNSGAALPAGSKVFHPVKIRIHIGNPLIADSALPYQEIATQIMQTIRQLAPNKSHQ